MDYALIGTIARLTNTRPNWDREVTRAVGTARVCAIAALIRALGAEVEYADLRGIELFQARPDFPDRPLRATNAIVRDVTSESAALRHLAGVHGNRGHWTLELSGWLGREKSIADVAGRSGVRWDA